MLASPSSTLSSASSSTAEAILSRARRLSSNAFERTHPPTSFTEGDSSATSCSTHHNSFDALLSNSRRSSYNQKKRRSTTPSSTTITSATPESTAILIEPLSLSTSTLPLMTTATTSVVIVQSPLEKDDDNEKEEDGESISNNSRKGLNHSPGTFLDPNLAQSTPPLCATLLTTQSTTTSSSSIAPALLTATTTATTATTSLTRPRACTGGETGIVIDASHQSNHRKYLSENGRGSLVHDILAVLRQHTDLESPVNGDSPSSSSQLLPVRKDNDGGSRSDLYRHETDEGAGITLTPVRSNCPSPPSTHSSTSSSGSKTAQDDDENTITSKDETMNTKAQTEHPPIEEENQRTKEGEVDTTVVKKQKVAEAEKGASIVTPDQEQRRHDMDPMHTCETILQQDHDKEQGHNITTTTTVLEKESNTTAVASSLSPSNTTTTSITASPSSTPTRTMSKGGSFLKKMGVRKNSFNEAAVPDIPTQSQSQQQQQQSDNSDACSIRSHTTQTSTTSSTSNLTKKRSSKKLMNKLVPKFLQTSFSSTATGTLSSAGTSTISTNSPQSSRVTAGGGLTSPVSSTRSSRSGSTCSEGPGLRKASSESVVVVEGPARVALPPSAPSSTKGSSQESLPLLVEEKVKEVEYVSTGTGSTALAVQTQSSPEFLRSLRLDTAGAIGMISRRLSNASGTKSDVPKQEPAAAPTTASATYLKVEVEYEEEAVEESESEDEEEEEDQEDELSKMTERSKQIEDDPPLSPYIIDENCDDDFFLNSVLRKKSVHTLHQAQDNKPQSQQGFSHTSPPHRYQSSSSIMTTSSRTSETTLYSMRSSPTLTEGWSSGESTPSPTSPYTVNGQVYPFPTMSTAKSNSIGLNMKYQTMQQQHRTNNNPLPAPIYAGQDQRRSRLRDAVGEWRRATNASN